MNNLSFSSKFSPQRDNGERALCWKAGKPDKSGMWLVTLKDGTVKGVLYDKSEDTGDVFEVIIAHMKLPTPYKPD